MDFVSPEGGAAAAGLSAECRHLSERHTNKEDKLQLNSIMFHSVKEALSVLMKE